MVHRLLFGAGVRAKPTRPLLPAVNFSNLMRRRLVPLPHATADSV